MRRHLALLLAATALVAGCDLAPRHVRPVGAVPATFPQSGSSTQAAVDARDVTAIAWRDFFLDDKLRQVIALGLENNRDLRVGAANVLQARSQYRVQRADRFPTLDLSASHESSRTPSTVESGTILKTEAFSYDVGVSAFELDFFGRVRNLSRAAFEQYLATQEAQRSLRISLIAEIGSAYLSLAADQALLDLARDTLESYRASLEVTRARFSIGIVGELDIRQAETALEGARGDVASLTTQVAQDRNALDLLAGAPVPTDLLPAPLDEATLVLADLPANLQSSILLQRPDVIGAEHLLRAQEANIGAARAAMFPTVSLTAAFGGLSNALSNLFDGNAEAWNVTPTISLPLFDAGRRNANLRYSQASREAAVATYEKTLQTAFREVADALALRGTISVQIDAREKGTRSAVRAALLSDARYRSGVDNYLVTLDAQRTSYAARQLLTATRLARAQNLIQLYRSLGGGLQ